MEDTEKKEKRGHCHNFSGGGVYGLGFLGALVYYIQHSDTFWMGVVGVLKAIFWPALLIYKVLELLKF